MIRTQSRVRVRVRARVIYLNQTDIRHQILGDVGVGVTFDNVRHIFKTLNDVTPLWKRSKDANAPASQLKPSDPPHPPAGMTGAFTFYASKSRWILCSPGANWMESLWSSLQDEVYFMGGGAAGGLWRNQQWTPSWPPCWILPRIRNQVKCAINGDFFGLTWKTTHK